MLTLALVAGLLSPASSGSAQAGGEPLPFDARFAPALTKQGLAGREAHAAIVVGLERLGAMQAADGSWAGDDPVVATSLALLALLGDGRSAEGAEGRAAAVRAAEWLRDRADDAGRFGSSVYAHATATAALAEASRYLSGDETRAAAESAARQLLDARSDGAWDGDPVLTGWCVYSLLTGQDMGLPLETAELAATRAWLEDRVAKTGAVEPLDETVGAKERATAAVLYARLRLGDSVKGGKYVARQVNRLVRKGALPDEELVDLDYWFMGSAALSQAGDAEAWKAWRAAASEALLGATRTPGGTWGSPDGEAVGTALAVLVLESSYRFRRAPQVFANVVGIGGGAGGTYGGRFGGKRNLRASGGSGTSEALAKALAWLAGRQNGEGAIVAGDTRHPVGATALALLAFLGDGHVTLRGAHKDTVMRAVKWLREQQQDSGRIGAGEGGPGAYEHAIATLALADAYYFSKSPLLRSTAQKAVDFAAGLQRDDGGWRYTTSDSDTSNTSLTGWMVAALRAGQEGGLGVDRQSLDSAIEWLDAMTDARGRVGYATPGGPSFREPGAAGRFPTERTEALTAEALFTRFLLGQTAGDTPAMGLHADVVAAVLPEWRADGSTCDMVYWYFGSYAMFQMGGKHWRSWNAAMKPAVVDSQRDDGSWEPIGPWGDAGGSVYATAMMALTLEVYFRYGRFASGR